MRPMTVGRIKSDLRAADQCPQLGVERTNAEVAIGPFMTHLRHRPTNLL